MPILSLRSIGDGVGSIWVDTDTGMAYRLTGDGASAAPAFASILGLPAELDGQYAAALHAIGNSGSAVAVNWNDSNVQSLTLTGNAAVTFTNPIAGARYCLIFSTGAGSFTPTFPASVKWLGSTPTLLTTASKKYIVALLYDGTDYLASYAEEA